MNKSDIRYMTFGKYKGMPILQVIASHIGYIMWCFENISWFRLNESEQKFYDWQAIAIKKYKVPMIFPVELMYKYVKDTGSLETLTTPYIFHGADPFIPLDVDIAEELKAAGVFNRSNNDYIDGERKTSMPWWYGLHHSAMKEIDTMTDDEIDEMVSMGLTPPIIPL